MKRLAVILHDLAWVPASIILAYWFRFNLGTIPPIHYDSILEIFIAALPFHALTFWLFGCYRGIWRFASLPDLLRIGKAIITGVASVGASLFLYDRFLGVPRSVIFLYPIFLFLGVVSSRVLYRIFRTHRIALDRSDRERALVVGAGRAGEMLVRDILDHGQFIPVAILDDDKAK